MPPIAVVLVDGVERPLAIRRERMREERLVGERDQRELVFRPDGGDELARRLLHRRRALLHAAAGVEIEHDRDGIHRLLKGVDGLRHAVFEHFEIVGGDVDELVRRVGDPEFHRGMKRRRTRREVAGARAHAVALRHRDRHLTPQAVLALIGRRVGDQVAAVRVGGDRARRCRRDPVHAAGRRCGRRSRRRSAGASFRL